VGWARAAAALKDIISPTVPILSTTKGIHVETEKLMYDVIPEALGRAQPAAFLSGPSFAKEMMQNFPTTVVIASDNADVAKEIQHKLSQTTFRVYTTNDVIGLEIGSARRSAHGREQRRMRLTNETTMAGCSLA